VAMIGLEEGLLPHARAATDEGEREEERRLCFVGMTRAKRALLLSRTRRRTHRGIPEIAIASSFLSEIPPGEVERVESGESDDDGFIGRGGRGASIRPDGAPLRTARAHPLVEAFPRGCVVRHPTFGLGRVEEVMARPSGVCAKIQFQQSGVKTLLLQYAHLTRLTDADFDAIDEAPPEP